jgi:peptidoglycan-N-acetylglucosamine deacetylase
MKIMQKKILLMGVFALATSGFAAQTFYTEGPKTAKRIALTFDDGPGPQTGEYLTLLDKYHVKATFFMLGELVQFRGAIAKDISLRGHEVASHTMVHANYNKKLKTWIQKLHDTSADHRVAIASAKKELMADMAQSRTLIEKATGQKIKLLRMPHGIDKPWIRDAAKESGFTLVNWTYGSDWASDPAEKLIPSYIKAIKPGAIFLLHDGGNKREKSLQITEALIVAAQKQGYEIVPVGELLSLK